MLEHIVHGPRLKFRDMTKITMEEQGMQTIQACAINVASIDVKTYILAIRLLYIISFQTS